MGAWHVHLWVCSTGAEIGTEFEFIYISGASTYDRAIADAKDQAVSVDGFKVISVKRVEYVVQG